MAQEIKDILSECGVSEYWLNPNKVKDNNYASFKKLYKEKVVHRSLYSRET